MTSPSGTPDYSTPLPGGAKTVLSASINWLSLGGPYTSAWFDVTAFSGLLIRLGSTTGLTDYGTCEVQFTDATGGIALPSYSATIQGNSELDVNVPVLGARARLVVSPGSIQIHTSALTVVGHGGGPSSSVASQGFILAEVKNIPLAASGVVSVVGAAVVEGPGYLFVLPNGTQSGYAQVWAFDSNGVSHLLARTDVKAATNGQVVPLWIPPQPLQLDVINATGVASNNYYGAIVKGRA